jgi:SulP family sulfate permease
VPPPDPFAHSRALSWVPKSVIVLKAYSWQTFRQDLLAGVTVGLVALPLALAFAISSGVKPEAGLYCAIVAGFLSSFFGGSRTQISGPTGAFVVVVAGIVAKHGLEGLFMCTMMAGVLMFLLGVTGLGTAVKFIPRPVVIGFTNGIALLIASTQIKDFLGLQIERVPSLFLDRLLAVFSHLDTISVPSTTLALVALTLLIVFARWVRAVPGAIVALVLGTAAAALFALPVETVGTRFGGIPSGLPTISIPEFRPELMAVLLSPALTVAMLGSIESLMSAVVADRMTGDRHNPNGELMGQGISNIVVPMVGGLPSTGAIARTATNIRSGAKTPVAGIVHALTLLAVVLFAAPLASHIPLPVLAAILLVVAYNMGEWKEIPQILKLSKADISVWLLTFGLTVFADLTVAVEAGMILAALLYIQKVTATTTVSEVTSGYIAEGFEHILQYKEIPENVTILRIHGPFLFGSTDKLEDLTRNIEILPKVVILRLRNMTAIDATGIQALEDLAERLHETGRHIVFCGMREQPERLMRKAGFDRFVGPENICPNVDAALARAKELALGHSEAETEGEPGSAAK